MQAQKSRYLILAAAIAVLVSGGCSRADDVRGVGNASATLPAVEPPHGLVSAMTGNGALRLGEYACYGSGGQVLIGQGAVCEPW